MTPVQLTEEIKASLEILVTTLYDTLELIMQHNGCSLFEIREWIVIVDYEDLAYPISFIRHHKV